MAMKLRFKPQKTLRLQRKREVFVIVHHIHIIVSLKTYFIFLQF